MKKKEKIFLMIIGGLLTVLVVYMEIRLWTSDGLYPIIPGWHTIIYPTAITKMILAVLILTASLLVYLIFKQTTKLLTLLWTRLKGKRVNEKDEKR